MSLSLTLIATPAPAAAPARSPVLRSPATRVTGYTLRGLISALLMLDASIKVFRFQAAVEGTAQLGFPEAAVLSLGLIEVGCLLLYLVPRTAILGAVLWTGYLGGAVATHVRLGNPLLTHMLSPVYVAVVLWLGLWLTDQRLRRVFDPA